MACGWELAPPAGIIAAGVVLAAARRLGGVGGDDGEMQAVAPDLVCPDQPNDGSFGGQMSGRRFRSRVTHYPRLVFSVDGVYF